MGSQYGLARHDVHSIKKFHFELNNPKSLKPYFIRTIYEDSQQNLWIGTGGGGLNLLNREKEEFELFLNKDISRNCHECSQIRKIIEDDNGLLWIGTYRGGINLMQIINQEFSFPHPSTASPFAM